jgi:DNA-directed RNA polymerase sigma subunit (sigma70/sigma32)
VELEEIEYNENSKITKEEETAILKRYQDGQEETVGELILRTYDYVAKIIVHRTINRLYKYYEPEVVRSVEEADLMQVARIAIIKSAKEAPLPLNYRFSSYAGSAIRRHVMREFFSLVGPIRIPGSAHQKLLEEGPGWYLDGQSRSPRTAAIRRLLQPIQLESAYRPLDDLDDEGDGLNDKWQTAKDLIVDPLLTEEIVEFDERMGLILDVLSEMRPKYRDILMDLYGIGSDDAIEMTYPELFEKYGSGCSSTLFRARNEAYRLLAKKLAYAEM